MSKKKVVVCDDNQLIRRVLSDMLEDKGYDTITASTVHELIRHLSRESYDLVIVDYVMPFITGIEAIKILRNNLELVDMPIVLMTADELNVIDKCYLDEEHIEVMYKPFDNHTMELMLDRCFSHKI